MRKFFLGEHIRIVPFVRSIVDMIEKKLIVGTVAILVLSITVQGITPVLADISGVNNTFAIFIHTGEGKVCWSGVSTGCTGSSTILTLPKGVTLTFTATGSINYRFVDFNSGSTTSSVYVALNPYTVTISSEVGQYIAADFTYINVNEW